ncbi:MAG: hypothetical protein ACOVQ7_14895 [Limnoraphis robusta]|jgi:hypothetical protein
MIESKVARQNKNKSHYGDKIKVDVYWHSVGLTQKQAITLCLCLNKVSFSSQLIRHRDPNCPDSIFIGSLVGAEQARLVISLIRYQIKYIFKPDYSEEQGGDLTGLKIGVGLMSDHYQYFRSRKDYPVKVSAENLQSLIQPHLSNTEFQQRLRNICWGN